VGAAAVPDVVSEVALVQHLQIDQDVGVHTEDAAVAETPCTIQTEETSPAGPILEKGFVETKESVTETVSDDAAVAEPRGIMAVESPAASAALETSAPFVDMDSGSPVEFTADDPSTKPEVLARSIHHGSDESLPEVRPSPTEDITLDAAVEPSAESTEAVASVVEHTGQAMDNAEPATQQIEGVAGVVEPQEPEPDADAPEARAKNALQDTLQHHERPEEAKGGAEEMAVSTTEVVDAAQVLIPAEPQPELIEKLGTEVDSTPKDEMASDTASREISLAEKDGPTDEPVLVEKNEAGDSGEEEDEFVVVDASEVPAKEDVDGSSGATEIAKEAKDDGSVKGETLSTGEDPPTFFIVPLWCSILVIAIAIAILWLSPISLL
jgi:hypothetical protein